jgi:hypothetical protein
MSIYYLIASLPALDVETAPALTPDAFVQLCREQLAPADAEAAAALVAGCDADHPFVRDWRDHDTQLRNAAARQRAARRATDPEPYQRRTHGCDLRTEREVESAFQTGDPLLRERQLDRIRWRIADELQGPDPMTPRAALAYAIKLRIAGRWAGITADAGRSAASRLLDAPVVLNDYARAEQG